MVGLTTSMVEEEVRVVRALTTGLMITTTSSNTAAPCRHLQKVRIKADTEKRDTHEWILHIYI